MLWASHDGERIGACPGAKAVCPCCKGTVLAKCGSIVTWHWAHEAAECDPWYEPESEWHIKWKRRFPVEWQEIVVGRHRADVKTPRLVVELQSSCISAEEIKERERYYRDMVWLLRGADFADNLSLRQRDGYLTFRWRWPRKSWWAATMPLIIDLPGSMIEVRKLYNAVPCGGWAKELTEEQFMARCGATTENNKTLTRGLR
jgi:competence protein CoiA